MFIETQIPTENQKAVGVQRFCLILFGLMMILPATPNGIRFNYYSIIVYL